VPFRCDLATGQVGVAWGAVVEGLVGSDGVVDLAEPVDFDGEGVAVLDGSAVEVLVLKGAEEPLDDAVGLRALDSGTT
jgi:hypothetical protein